MSRRRSSVSDIEATIASQTSSLSAGIIRSQRVSRNVQASPISSQSAAAMSMSKPTIVPSAVTSEKGG